MFNKPIAIVLNNIWNILMKGLTLVNENTLKGFILVISHNIIVVDKITADLLKRNISTELENKV